MLKQVVFTVFQAEDFLTGNVKPGSFSKVFHILKSKGRRESKSERQRERQRARASEKERERERMGKMVFIC